MTLSFSSNSSLGIIAGGDPVELWEEITQSIEDSVWTDPTKMILNIAHGQCVDATAIVNHMRSLGVSDDEILRRVYLIDKYTFFTNYAKRLGFKNVIHGDFLEMEFDVKFDVILGNPPFSEPGSGKDKVRSRKPLYPAFYEKSVSLLKEGGTMALVIPDTRHKADKRHNDNIQKTANKIFPITEEMRKLMGVSIEMWCVISDGSGTKPDVEFTHGKVNNNIPWNISKFNQHKPGIKESIHEDKEADDVLIHFRDAKSPEGYVERYIEKDLVDDRHLFPKSGWAVIMPVSVTRSMGFKSIRVVECVGDQIASRDNKIVFVDTKEQADRFVSCIRSDDLIDQLWRNRNSLGDVIYLSGIQNLKFNKEDEDYIING
jgi:hypothetical protein